jgi:hypothetical protein
MPEMQADLSEPRKSDQQKVLVPPGADLLGQSQLQPLQRNFKIRTPHTWPGNAG